jgi:hypothetical protein
MDLEQAPAFIRRRRRSLVSLLFFYILFYNINFIKIKNDVDIVIEYKERRNRVTECL